MSSHYRKILHVDMDAFFASVEQRNHPKLKGKPVVVGSPNPRGVIAAASYEARRYGIRSAMASKRAKELCPELIFVQHHFEDYKNVSQEIHQIFRRYTDIIEPLSLDEAFLDVTENKSRMVLGQDVAKAIKKEIKTELHLTASAGVSYNKFLAKIASDMQKPDGLTVIHPNNALKIISKLPIEAFWGVGRVTAQKMHAAGIFSGKELQCYDKELLKKQFGKLGVLLSQFAIGNDPRKVETHRERKSVGCEQTFREDIFQKQQILEKINQMAVELEKRIARAKFEGHTLTLKIKRDDFKLITHSHTNEHIVQNVSDIVALAKQLFEEINLENHAIRLIGVSMSNPTDKLKNAKLADMNIQLKIPFREW